MLGAKQELRGLIKSSESTSASVPAKQVLSSEGINASTPTADRSQTVLSCTVPMNESQQIKLYSTYILTQEKMTELWKALFRFLGLCERQKCPLTPPNSPLASQGAQTQDAAGQLKGLHCRINSDKLQIKKKPVICVKEAAFAAKWIHLSLLLIAPFPQTVP